MVRVSGVTFIKGAFRLGYPVLESIQSIAPFCDEVVINVGFDDPSLTQDDGTYQYLRDHLTAEKFVFLKNWWDPQLSAKGLVLSQQTNIALAKARGKFAQYIQADEAIHQDDYSLIEQGIKKLIDNPRVQGLVYQYHHFYGDPYVERRTRLTYRREVRMIRLEHGIKSHLDAQGFLHQDGSKLLCFETAARVFHYGWARSYQAMVQKIEQMNKLYHGQDFHTPRTFEYRNIWGLKTYKGTHPAVMMDWIEKNRLGRDLLSEPLVYQSGDWRLYLSDTVERLIGYRLGEYKNFKLCKI